MLHAGNSHRLKRRTLKINMKKDALKNRVLELEAHINDCWIVIINQVVSIWMSGNWTGLGYNIVVKYILRVLQSVNRG